MEKCICKNCGKEFLGKTAKQCFYCCQECKKELSNICQINNKQDIL